MPRSKILWALVALNAGLLVALTWKLGGENVARAQARPGRGEYVMIPSRVTGAKNGVLYMVDTRNGILSGFFYESDQGSLVPIDPINLTRIFESAAGMGAGGGNRQPPRRP